MRWAYLPLRAKFLIALVAAIAWTVFSVWVSLRWLNDLAMLAGWPFALITIGFIAYVPGFMNAFLIATLLLDRRPPLRPVAHYPGVTILVAAYNEAGAIRAMYAVLGPLYPVWKTLFPRLVTTTGELGRALVRIAREGADRRVIGSERIAELGRVRP